MAGLVTHQDATDRRPAAGCPATGATLWRPAVFALAVLTLLILCTAPAARGVAAGPGDQVWINWLDGPDHTLDAITQVAEAPDGSLYAFGVTNDDWAAGADLLLVKQTPSAGTGSWTLAWDGAAGDADLSEDLVVDGRSNAIMVGTSVTLAKQRDWVLVKYSSSRTPKWQKYWGGTGEDFALAADADAEGNVYVCGTRATSATSADWKVVKFHARTGTVAWVCTYTSPDAAHAGGMPIAMTVDDSGSVYVTGTSPNRLGSRDVLVIKVSPKGSLLWKRRIDGPSHLSDQGVAIAAAPSGGVYVAAESWTGTARNKLLLVRLSASGRYPWAGIWRTWRDTSIPGLNSVQGLELDGAGNLYLAGYTWDPNVNDSRGYIQKRAPDGRLRWAHFYRPSTVAQSAFYDLAVSSVGRAWVVGTATPVTGTKDWLLARYESNGTRAWASIYDTPGDHLDDWANAVTLCGADKLFAGGVMGTSTNDDAGTAKYVR
jgi:hypothetical protein